MLLLALSRSSTTFIVDIGVFVVGAGGFIGVWVLVVGTGFFIVVRIHILVEVCVVVGIPQVLLGINIGISGLIVVVRFGGGATQLKAGVPYVSSW